MLHLFAIPWVKQNPQRVHCLKLLSSRRRRLQMCSFWSASPPPLHLPRFLRRRLLLLQILFTMGGSARIPLPTRPSPSLSSGHNHEQNVQERMSPAAMKMATQPRYINISQNRISCPPVALGMTTPVGSTWFMSSSTKRLSSSSPSPWQSTVALIQIALDLVRTGRGGGGRWGGGDEMGRGGGWKSFMVQGYRFRSHFNPELSTNQIGFAISQAAQSISNRGARGIVCKGDCCWPAMKGIRTVRLHWKPSSSSRTTDRPNYPHNILYCPPNPFVTNCLHMRHWPTRENWLLPGHGRGRRILHKSEIYGLPDRWDEQQQRQQQQWQHRRKSYYILSRRMVQYVQLGT